MIGPETRRRLAETSAHGSIGMQEAKSNAVPRELRIFERLEGLVGGANELANHLEGLAGRIVGTGAGCSANASEHAPIGNIFDAISHIEQDLMRCRKVVNELDESF